MGVALDVRDSTFDSNTDIAGPGRTGSFFRSSVRPTYRGRPGALRSAAAGVHLARKKCETPRTFTRFCTETARLSSHTLKKCAQVHNFCVHDESHRNRPTNPRTRVASPRRLRRVPKDSLRSLTSPHDGRVSFVEFNSELRCVAWAPIVTSKFEPCNSTRNAPFLIWTSAS